MCSIVISMQCINSIVSVKNINTFALFNRFVVFYTVYYTVLHSIQNKKSVKNSKCLFRTDNAVYIMKQTIVLRYLIVMKQSYTVYKTKNP